MAQLTLALLGSLQVLLDDQPVIGLGYAKVCALLIYLAVEARPHGRDALASLLWPDRPSAVARRSLRVALTTLRQALGDPTNAQPFVLASHKSIQINPNAVITLDVSAFVALLQRRDLHTHPASALCPECVARLSEAVALYRGDFLQQLEVRAGAAFDEWATLWRERLHSGALAALRELSIYHEAQGDTAAARQGARRALAMEPWDEVALRCLMRVLARQGQRGAALAQYARCRQVLLTELGVEPAPETSALAEQIRAHALSRTGGSAPPSPSSASLPGEPPTARAADVRTAQPCRLPAPLTAFIGRERELAELGELVCDPACRLLTIVGIGGSGKTRLAIQVAQKTSDGFVHGVYFVALAAINTSDFLVAAIADSLGFPFNSNSTQDLKTQLLNYLHEKQILLVLDNFEHLLDGAGLLVDILTNAAAIKIVVTSRERLNLHGEWLYEVQGLAVPSADDPLSLEQYSAAQLFLQSARRTQPGFTLTAINKRGIARLCRIVEGLPLGLELAASWLAMLSCDEIVHELEQSRSFFAASSGAMSEQHRSIHDVFERSWTLLSHEQRALFQRLSVFRGGFGREAAQDVAGASLPILAALIDKSLLRRSPAGRYDLHELLRQYAAEKLALAPDEQEGTYDRHSRYYLEFLCRQEQQLKGRQQQQALEEIVADVDNIRLACQRAVARRWAGELGRATQSLWLFYDFSGLYREAEALFGRAAASLAEDRGGNLFPPYVAQEATSHVDFAAEQGASSLERRERATALGQILSRQGWFLFRLGQRGKAKALHQQSVALLRSFEARMALADALQTFSMVTWTGGEYQEAQQILQEGLALFSEQGSSWDIALCLCCLGNVAGLQGHYREAKQLLQRALALFKVNGDSRLITLTLGYLGLTVYKLGEYNEAKQWFRESLSLSRAMGYRWNIALCLNQLSEVTYQAGPAEWQQVQALLEESLAISQDLGDRREMAVSLNHLGRLCTARGEHQAAHRHFLAALQMAMDNQVAPLALRALAGLAALWLYEPPAASVQHSWVRKERAAEVLAFVLSHPAAEHETIAQTRCLLAELTIEPEPRGVAAAQTRSLDELVAELLSQEIEEYFDERAD